MNEPTEGLARYKSKQVVSAGKITRIVPYGCYVQEADGTTVLREYAPNMLWRSMAVVGDYWVIYDDGFQSLAAAKAFEEGYEVQS